MTSFQNAALIADYADRTTKIIPGLRDLHRMASVLLAERAPRDAKVLVLGAGGGMELKAFAEMQPRWSFVGVDPSAEMLALARVHLGPLQSSTQLHQGFIDSAPSGPFDGATSLLTLHFLDKADRRRTLKAVFDRLKPGAPFVMAHHSFANLRREADRWLSRCAAFAVASGLSPAQAHNVAAIRDQLPVFSPDQEVELLEDAGFADIEMFYCAFTFKGWVAHKPIV